MILAFDVGNTIISVALIKGQKIKIINRLDSSMSNKLIANQIMALVSRLKRKHSYITSVIICSVVPALTRVISRKIKKGFGLKIYIIGKDVKVPIKNKYRKPKQVGQDRLVGAFAAKQIYGAPLIIVDFGTAITFDVVSAKGDYEGGIIVPGIRLSAESLFSKTALLPRIDRIKAPKNLIGKETKESILSGLFNGYGNLCTGLINQIQSGLDKKAKVIITGGHTQMIGRFIRANIDKVDHDLIFKGLVLIMRN